MQHSILIMSDYPIKVLILKKLAKRLLPSAQLKVQNNLILPENGTPDLIVVDLNLNEEAEQLAKNHLTKLTLCKHVVFFEEDHDQIEIIEDANRLIVTVGKRTELGQITELLEDMMNSAKAGSRQASSSILAKYAQESIRYA